MRYGQATTGQSCGAEVTRRTKLKPEAILVAYHANIRSVLANECITWGYAVIKLLARLGAAQDLKQP